MVEHLIWTIFEFVVGVIELTLYGPKMLFKSGNSDWHPVEYGIGCWLMFMGRAGAWRRLLFVGVDGTWRRLLFVGVAGT